jgi:dynein light intermediate chain 1
VYTVPSSAPSYTSLLPHFLPPRSSLPQTVVVIVLDWTRPWTFIEELETWIKWIENWAKGDGSRELEIVREESRERRSCNFYLSIVKATLTFFDSASPLTALY